MLENDQAVHRQGAAIKGKNSMEGGILTAAGGVIAVESTRQDDILGSVTDQVFSELGTPGLDGVAGDG